MVRRDSEMRRTVLQHSEHRAQHPSGGRDLGAVGSTVGRNSEVVPKQLVGAVDQKYPHRISLTVSPTRSAYSVGHRPANAFFLHDLPKCREPYKSHQSLRPLDALQPLAYRYTIFRPSLVTVLHRRARVLGCGLVATMVLAMVATSVAPQPAFADGVGDTKAQAAALAQKINSDNLQVQILDQQYDGAQYHLAQVEQQMTTAKQQLRVALVDDQRSRAALASEAVVAYMDGGVTGAPSMRSLQRQCRSISRGGVLPAGRRQPDRCPRPVPHQRGGPAPTAGHPPERPDRQPGGGANVSSQKQAVVAASAATQSTLNQVQGQLVQLVAQQQAQIAAQQAAQVKAQLLAAASAAQASAGQASAAQGAAAQTGAAQAAASRATTTAPRAGSAQSSSASPSSGASPSSSASPSSTSAKSSGTVPGSSGASPGSSPPAVRFLRLAPEPPRPSPLPGRRSASPTNGAGPGRLVRLLRSDDAGMGRAGVSLPHYSVAQYADTAHIPIADLQPGDLVFFGSDIHHVGLYIGNGQMIDAPDTGSFVRVDSIYWSDLDPEGGRPLTVGPGPIRRQAPSGIRPAGPSRAEQAEQG